MYKKKALNGEGVLLKNTKRKNSKIKEMLISYLRNNIKEYSIVMIIFLIGLIFGVIFVNNAGKNQINEITSYINDFVGNLKNNIEINKAQLLKDTLISNFLLALELWFVGSTVIGLPIVYGMIAYRGFCLGYTISSIIATLGMRKRNTIYNSINIISKYFHLLRKKHNYTQDELAKRLDISRQAVSKWETGAAIPDLEVLLKISKLYGITINDILEPNIPTKKITDFEQLSKVPENELRDILEQYDMTSLVIASMGASPEINNLLEKLFPDVDYKMERNRIGRVRIDEVERIQQEIVSVINLRALDSELL